jgi:hypothetical protein
MTDLSTTQTNTFGYTGGIQTVTVGTAGYYDITADGAQGGNVNALSVESGGLGAMASGDIYLAAGAVLKIVVGGAGGSASGYSAGGGGGGGSFVIESNSGSGSVDIDEVIAGGGGGANTQANGQGGLAGQTGGNGGGAVLPSNNGNSFPSGGAGGRSGAAGHGASSFGGGGGGFTGGAGGARGTAGSGSVNGISSAHFSGGAGGATGAGGGHGGFGGGGGGGGGSSGGGGGGGGGGGYGGGGGGQGHASTPLGGGSGGGGGSLVNSTVATLTPNTHSGDGLVTITEVPAPPCYCTGTRILTERGEVAVEDLKIGDHVITHSNHSVPIKWIGHRELNCERHPAPESVWPVVVRADAFGPGMPSRDLWLSPGHNVVSEGVLIPIGALRNGRTVEQVRQPNVEYWHIELGTHDILFAHGLPAESYLDTGNRCAFSNGGAFIEQHPDFRPKHWAQTCLPLIHEGREITQSRRLLLERAVALGHVVTSQDDLHIMADQRRIEPVRLSDTRRFFSLPDGCEDVSLRSRQFVPAHVNPESGDWRVLGICVGRLQIDGQAVALDQDDAFTNGWHDVEQDPNNLSQRWTHGVTPLPAGCRLIVIDIAGRGYYWSEHDGDNVALFRALG